MEGCGWAAGLSPRAALAALSPPAALAKSSGSRHAGRALALGGRGAWQGWGRGPGSRGVLTAGRGGRQEALRKIITTLAVKNEEIQNFIYSLKQMMQNVEVTGSPPCPAVPLGTPIPAAGGGGTH